MVAILGAYALFGIGFIGIGAVLYRLMDKTPFSPVWAFWVGWGMVISVLQIWHLFMPIDDTIVGAIVLIGAFGILMNIPLFWRALLPISFTKSLWLFATLLITLYVANRATYSTADYTAFGFDTGFYHLPVIEWFSQHPIVIGLGNVHTRFGFSNAHFLYGGLFNRGEFLDKPYILMNSLLYIIFLSQTVWSIILIWESKEKPIEHIFRVLCLPFVLMWMFWRSAEGLGISSTSNDVPIFMLGILLVGRVLSVVESRKSVRSDIIIVTLLVCVGISIKFSFVVLGGLLLILALGLFIHQHPSNYRIIGIVAIISAVILIPMMIRSVIMTGYPLYPLTIGGLDVDWRVNTQTALYESEHIQTFGRVLGDTPMYDTLINHPDSEWIPFWLEKSSRDYPVFFYTPIILGVIGFLLIIVKRKIRITELFLIDTLIISIAFWFITAPLWRLSGGVTWLFGAGLVAMGVSRFYKHITTFLLVAMCAYMVIDGTQNRGFVFEWVSGEQPTPLEWIEPTQTFSGLTVNVSQNWLCWGYELPCVPKQHYSPLLQARTDGGYRLPSYVLLFDPTTYQIQLVMDTLEAIALDSVTPLTARLTPLDAQFMPITDTSEFIFPLDYANDDIQSAQLESRNNFPTTKKMGIIQLPDLPNGYYQLVSEWDSHQTILADIWQIRSFRFGDVLQLTDTLLNRENTRLKIELVGMPLMPIGTRYHVAIWLRGENGVFQQDISPQIPTHDWTMGEQYTITAYFDDIPRGNFRLSVVFYDVYAPNLPRLEGFDDQNQALGDEVLLLEGDF